MGDFITPEGHRDFLAKRLFDGIGQVEWGALAYIQKGGGGPEGGHTHASAHVFIVAEGEVQVMLDGEPHTVKQDEVFFVPGGAPHSIWNRGEATAKVIKLNVRQEG